MKNKIIKIISTLMVVLVLISTLAIPSFAASPSFTVTGGTATVGNNVTVNIAISSASNVCGGNFTLEYDSNKLTASSYSVGSILNSYISNCNLNYQSSGNKIRFTFSGSNTLTSNGTILSIVFKTKTSGTAALKLTSYKLYDANGSSISMSVSNGSVKVNDVSAPTSYTVTYNAKGGSVSPSSVTVTSGNSTTLPTPTKSYTITYNANGGSNAPSSQSVSLTCKGWSTSSSATSASYSCGSSYKPTSAVTLYAVWNSSVSTNLKTGTPAKSGYTFLGWSKSSNATSSSYDPGDTITLTSNTTLYAVWKKNPTTTYTLSYNANGGSVSPKSASVSSGSSVKLPTPTKTYVFKYDANGGSNAPSSQSASLGCKGWSTSSSATSASYSCGSSYKPTSSVTLYAVWEKEMSLTLRSSEPTREGYIFLGWAIDENATTPDFESGENITVTFNSNIDEGAITLYAVWEENTENSSTGYTFWEWLIIIFLFGWIWYI